MVSNHKVDDTPETSTQTYAMFVKQVVFDGPKSIQFLHSQNESQLIQRTMFFFCKKLGPRSLQGHGLQSEQE